MSVWELLSPLYILLYCSNLKQWTGKVKVHIMKVSQRKVGIIAWKLVNIWVVMNNLFAIWLMYFFQNYLNWYYLRFFITTSKVLKCLFYKFSFLNFSLTFLAFSILFVFVNLKYVFIISQALNNDGNHCVVAIIYIIFIW